MEAALEEARLAFDEGEVPVGAVVVKNGEIIGRGHNTRETNLDIAGHAEINAMREAAKTLERWSLSGCDIYVTLEPCQMCGAAILQSRVSTIVYGADDPEYGAISKPKGLFDQCKPLIYRGVMKEECEEMLANFFAAKRIENS